MDQPVKVTPRKRVIVGWRQLERQRVEIRQRQRTVPVEIVVKRER